MPFLFEKLKVCQKAVEFADVVTELTGSFPRGSYYLADQLNRAALSVSADIAEGNGRFTKADRRNFFGIARGSVHECVPILEICRRRGLFPRIKRRTCDRVSTKWGNAFGSHQRPR